MPLLVSITKYCTKWILPIATSSCEQWQDYPDRTTDHIKAMYSAPSNRYGSPMTYKTPLNDWQTMGQCGYKLVTA